MRRRRAGSTRRAQRGKGGDPIETLRTRIDDLDRKLVRLLNTRAGCAIALGRLKRARGLPIYQPAREEEVLGNVQRTNPGPLEAEALRRLFERIIDESRRIERLTTGHEGAPGGARGAADEAAGEGRD